MSRLMGYWARKRMAVVMAFSLVMVSLPGYSGTAVIHAGAAVQEDEPADQPEQAELSAIQQTQNDTSIGQLTQDKTLRQTQDNASAGQQAQEKRITKKISGGLRGVGETGTSTVVFSKSSGTYGEEFNLELNCTAEADIYYTADGSDPSDPDNEARQLYTADGIRIADRKNDPNVLAAIDPILFDATNVKASADRKSFESTVEKPSDEAVDKCTVIKAAAQYADGTCSEVTTNTYFIGEMADHIEGIRQSCEAAGMDLSVMSISMDADDLFDSTKGIYVKGDVFNKAFEEYLKKNGSVSKGNAVNDSRDMDANYKQKGKAWERNTHIDYFESNGTDTSCKLQQDCGIRIQGNYSRSDYQKSFRLYARAEYGDKNFRYGFWDQAKNDDGNVIEKYKKIVLRNGGNCAFTTKFSDAYWQSLMEGIHCDTQSARPCVVYLNGEYWGVYILQDDFTDAYFENKHGVDKNNIVIYKGDAEANQVLGYKLDEGNLPEGVTNENYYFEEIENFMAEHDDLSNQADYDAFCKLVDKDSALDYFATEVWINNKWDWPGKNWSMWKSTVVDPNNPYADGKWRFLVYDVEFGGISGSEDANANTIKNSNLLTTGTAEQYSNDHWDKPNVRCFALLMTNPGFREEYKARLSGFSDTMFEQTHLLERAEQFKNVYQPILDQFFNRFPTLWGNSNKKKTAEMAINGNGWDTYGTWANIVAFVEERADNISTITKYIDKKYPVTATPTPTAAPIPTEKPKTTPVPTPAGSSAPTVNSEGGSNELIKVPLSDGTQKIVQLDAGGKVISTKYQIEGVTYLLKSNKTLAYSVDNNKTVKKKSSIVIADQVVAGGNRYTVTEIEAGALKNLKKLKSVTIGENVKTIGKNAFSGCKKLKKITFLGKKVKKIGSKAFSGIAKKANLICPKAKRKAYQKLIKKSGVNLKKTKIKIVGLKQSSAKGSTNVSKEKRDTALPVNSGKNSQGSLKGSQNSSLQGSQKSASSSLVASQHQQAVLRMDPVSIQNTKKAEQDAESGQETDVNAITMSSLVKADGSFQNAAAGTTVTISSAEELKLLSEYTRAEYTTAGITFRQTADIDGTDVVMEPIGARNAFRNVDEDGDSWTDYKAYPFCGVYDGAGYSIKNVKIAVEKNEENVYYLALFGMTEGAALQNINLDSIAFVDADTLKPFGVTGNEQIYMAGIAAYVGNDDEITGCTNHADLEVAGAIVNLAGIASYCYSAEFKDCHNTGNITARHSGTEDMFDISASGIAGYVSFGLQNCTNTGTIESDGDASGIANYSNGSVSNCDNSGNISGKQQAAGIVIETDYDVSSSKNSGEISSDEIAAGIVAYLYGEIINSENTGAVHGEYAGGIVGKASYFIRISAVKNSGKVTGKKAAGGIMAYAREGAVSNAQNLGDVHGTQAAGGIMGCMLCINVGNVWNSGAISGEAQVGGVTGSADHNNFDYDDYDEISEEYWASEYFNCVNTGTVSGGTEMGALIGHSAPKDVMSHCYYLEGTDLPVSGSDTALTAEAVSADKVKTQGFLDQLNQNLNDVQGTIFLPVKYDENGKLSWAPKIFLHIYWYGYEEDNAEAVKQLKDRFTVTNLESGEAVPLTDSQGVYSIDAKYGTHYNIVYHGMHDVERVLCEDFSLQEGDFIYTYDQYIRNLSFYTGAEWIEDDEGYGYYSPVELYQMIFYMDTAELQDLVIPDPEKEGSEFGGWYTRGCVTSDERYEQYIQEQLEEFQQDEQRCRENWMEYDYFMDEYESEEDYVRQMMLSWYGAETLEEYEANFEELFDQRYRIADFIADSDDGVFYARWAKKWEKQPDPTQPPNLTQTPQPTAPTVNQPPKPTIQPIDPSRYQDKEGDYVQKKGLIYKVNRKKKTASLVGVTSKSVTKVTIAAQVKTGGKSYKMNAISKKAFQGCSNLKKITAKGKSLKAVKKKALKMIRKK